MPTFVRVWTFGAAGAERASDMIGVTTFWGTTSPLSSIRLVDRWEKTRVREPGR